MCDIKEVLRTSVRSVSFQQNSTSNQGGNLSSKFKGHPIIFYGRPYCGKGEQAKLLRAALSASHMTTEVFSMSKACMEYARNPQTPHDERDHIIECIERRGQLVESGIAGGIFHAGVASMNAANIIFDGVPRNPLQVDWFTNCEILTVFHFDISRSSALDRRMKRVGESIARGESARPDDSDVHMANSRQDEFDGHDAEMQRLLKQLAEDGYHTIDASMDRNAVLIKMLRHLQDRQLILID